MKVKVGDWVKPLVNYIGQDGCSYTFEENAYQIERFNGDKIYLKGVDYPCFEESELKLVCGFVKGEEIEASNNTECWGKYKFELYRPDLDYPFVVSLMGKSIKSFKYAKPITEKEYKPYSKPKLEWIGEDLLHKDFKYKVTIKEIGIDYVIFECGDQKWLDELYRFYTRLDGTPFGELKDAN